MRIENTSIRLAAVITASLGAGWLLYIGSHLILPLIFAAILATFLNPLEKKLKPIVKYKWISITLCFLALILPFLIISTLFSFQLISIVESMPTIGSNMEIGLDKVLNKIEDVIPFLKLERTSLLPTSEQSNLTGPIKLLTKGLASTTNLLASLGLTFIYAFLLLFYKVSFNNFLIYQFDKENRRNVKEVIQEIKDTIQAYIGGMGLVMLILSIANSVGLYLIGIEYALFWGILAGILAVIPYIGTLIGGLLPFIYALATADYSWQPSAVIIYYLFIQQLEGNFITPTIVGDKVDINPLFAIMSLVFFGSFWGIAGVILALPIISIIKIVLSLFPESLPYATLMSSDVKNKKGIFKQLSNLESQN